jgi:hypothetical protein
MTQQEIQERNKQIALMLGWTLKSYPTYISSPFHSRSVWWSPGTTKTFCCIEGEEFFHSDWTWLMEAVEFIESRGYEIDIFANCVEICTTPDEDYVSEAVGKTKKEAVFIAVSDFAKLYNERKL